MNYKLSSYSLELNYMRRNLISGAKLISFVFGAGFFASACFILMSIFAGGAQYVALLPLWLLVSAILVILLPKQLSDYSKFNSRYYMEYLNKKYFTPDTDYDLNVFTRHDDYELYHTVNGIRFNSSSALDMRNIFVHDLHPFSKKRMAIIAGARGEECNDGVMLICGTGHGDEELVFLGVDDVFNDIMGNKEILGGIKLEEIIDILGSRALSKVTSKCKYEFEVDMFNLHANPQAMEKYKGNSEAINYWFSLYAGTAHGYVRENIPRAALCVAADESFDRGHFLIKDILPKGVRNPWRKDKKVYGVDFYAPSFVLDEMIDVVEKEPTHMRHALALWFKKRLHSGDEYCFYSYVEENAARQILHFGRSQKDLHSIFFGDSVVSGEDVVRLARRIVDVLDIDLSTCTDYEKIGYLSLFGPVRAIQAFPNDKRLFLSTDLNL